MLLKMECHSDWSVTQIGMSLKLKFQNVKRTRMNFGIKTHFRKMHDNTLCDGCQLEESTTRHTLECSSLIGRNELVTYEDLFGTDKEEQVYIARIICDNLKRMPSQ